MPEQSERYPTFKEALGVSPEILRLAQGDLGCPHLIYCVWKSGRHAIMRLTCKSWRCANCAQVKITQMTQALADATLGNDILFEIIGSLSQQETIGKYIRRKNISALSIKFTNSIYVLADQEAVGKDWQSNPISRFDAIIKVHTVDRNMVKRRDFLQNWKPESTYEPKRDTVVLTRKFNTIREADLALKELGQDLNSDLVIGDPLDLMELMVRTGGNYKLELGSAS